MPRGDKSAYTEKQKRQAQHIEKSYESRGESKEKAEEIAWATVNKQDGGGKLAGSGRSTPVEHTRSKKAESHRDEISKEQTPDKRSASANKTTAARNIKSLVKKP